MIGSLGRMGSTGLIGVANLNKIIIIPPDPGDVWILASNSWNDLGVWDDTAVWKD